MRFSVNVILACVLCISLVSCKSFFSKKKEQKQAPPPVAEKVVEQPPLNPMMDIQEITVELSEFGRPQVRLTSRAVPRRLALSKVADKTVCVYVFSSDVIPLQRFQCYNDVQLIVPVYRPADATTPGSLGISLELLDCVKKTLTPLVPSSQLPQTGSAVVDTGEVFFSSAKTGRLDLWRQAVNAAPQLFSTDNLVAIDPTVSPSGEQVFFTAYDPAQPAARKLWLLNTDRYASKKPLFLCDGQSAAWSPDSRRVVYTDAAGAAIWTMDATGSHNHRITPADANWIERNAVWSADGTKLIFSSNRGSASPEFFHLWQCDADGKNAIQLTFGAVLDDAPLATRSGMVFFRTFRAAHWAIYALKL